MHLREPSIVCKGPKEVDLLHDKRPVHLCHMDLMTVRVGHALDELVIGSLRSLLASPL